MGIATSGLAVRRGWAWMAVAAFLSGMLLPFCELWVPFALARSSSALYYETEKPASPHHLDHATVAGHQVAARKPMS
jgi:hypothetical protein